ncbi:MAG: spermidine synthase [Planctomycetota bacterium]|jgi:spermidine synthase
MKYTLEIVAFFSGMVVMILELTGSRIVAPYLGTSVIIWTSLIGVILASLAVGYWLGGKYADKNPDIQVLQRILLLAGVFIILIALMQPLLIFISSGGKSLEISAIIAMIVLFSPATVALGMVSPYVIRLKLTNISDSGSTVGAMYAISTLGSIFGTFLGGFVLISLFGSIKILFIIAAIILILATLVSWQKRLTVLICILFILLASILFFHFSPKVLLANNVDSVFDIDTTYSRIWGYEKGYGPENRQGRFITSVYKGIQSGIYLDDTDELMFEYAKGYDLMEYYNPTLQNVLMVGGGAYTYPRYFSGRYPQASMDIVEIDEGMLDLAREYFSYTNYSNVHEFFEDGRRYLNSNKKIYDAVLIDAFSNTLAIPFHLTTVEASREIRESLSDNGVAIINVVGSLVGEKSLFVSGYYHTLRSVFPEVSIYKMTNAPEIEIQSLIFVANKLPGDENILNERQELRDILAKKWTSNIPISDYLLTDDYAPVERLLY